MDLSKKSPRMYRWHGRKENWFLFASDMIEPGWIGEILLKIDGPVYLTIDLDYFDPSVMPSVGTPEPGGLLWDEVSELLETVARQRRVVGFDVTELAPSLGPRANAQLAAKLTYRLIGLAVRE